MSEAKFTPGPWRAEKVSKFGECDIYGPNGEELALIYVSNGADDPEMWPAEANARLIASAPDLLDSVYEFLERYEDMESAELFAKLPGEEAQRVVRARAALSKATGE
jgi:hypothetical protein